MHLLYFDENKYSEDNPFFTIGGVLVPESKVLDLDKTLTRIQSNFFGSSLLTAQTEFHGFEMFQGKGVYKNRRLSERVQLFDDLSRFLIDEQIPVRLVRVDVKSHREQHKFPTPEYRVGLMILLEIAHRYLDQVDDLGIAFGDYEQDEMARSVVDFSEYRTLTDPPMYQGRPLGRLVDTVYFCHSHHSRFLQLADLVVYMAGRYMNMQQRPDKWHDARVFDIWEEIKASENFQIHHWP